MCAEVEIWIFSFIFVSGHKRLRKVTTEIQFGGHKRH